MRSSAGPGSPLTSGVGHIPRTRAAESHDPHDRLAPRERLVLDHLLQGKTCAEIACELKRSPKTVEAQRTAVMNKLGVMNLVELGIYGARWGVGAGVACRMTTPSVINTPIGSRTLRRLCGHCSLPLPTGKASHWYCTKQALNRAYRARQRELGAFVGESVAKAVGL